MHLIFLFILLASVLALVRIHWTALIPLPYDPAMPIMRHVLRDIAAVSVTAIYALPIVWWALSSITPNDALLDLSRALTFDYVPTFESYALAVFGAGGTIFDSRQSLIDSFVVALISTVIAITAALPASFALSHLRFSGRRIVLHLFLMQRFLPAVALIFPLVVIYHAGGLIDTQAGLALAHAGLNMPLAILLLKSFMDDVPTEVDEAATLDGASRAQVFWKIVLPLIKPGIIAAAILCFIFSWTEFMLSLFLTQNLRLVPVQAQILNMNMWGNISALTTAAFVPVFIFVLLMQKHLVRGLTMGLYK